MKFRVSTYTITPLVLEPRPWSAVNTRNHLAREYLIEASRTAQIEIANQADSRRLESDASTNVSACADCSIRIVVPFTAYKDGPIAGWDVAFKLTDIKKEGGHHGMTCRIARSYTARCKKPPSNRSSV